MVKGGAEMVEPSSSVAAPRTRSDCWYNEWGSDSTNRGTTLCVRRKGLGLRRERGQRKRTTANTNKNKNNTTTTPTKQQQHNSSSSSNNNNNTQKTNLVAGLRADRKEGGELPGERRGDGGR
eukprot:1405387-Rhodomonas_salina.1